MANGLLEGRVVLVTGGAAGIGATLARGLGARGAKLVVFDRAPTADILRELEIAGIDAAGLDGDVTDAGAVEAAIALADARFGGLDVLVNNAGIYASLVPGPFTALEAEDWRRVLDVNVVGSFLCCRAAVPAMRRRGGGRIVNISSGVAFKGNPLMAHYVASKGAVVSMTRALASELGAEGILVNSVAPGFTLSENVLRNEALVAGVKGPSLRNRVLARDMTPEDLVGAVAFFAGPDSAFITGQTLVVDGGAYFN